VEPRNRRQGSARAGEEESKESKESEEGKEGEEGEAKSEEEIVTTYIGLLRAINLGAHNKIAMSDLRALLEKLGFTDPKTLILSGNVVFKSAEKSAAKIEQVLEAATAKHLGVTTDYFVRSASEWQAMIAANPFRAQAKSDPARMVAMCLKGAPSPAQVKTLQAAIKGPEQVRAKGSAAYFVYPDGMGRSKLSIALIERTLGTRGTARNWNTVLKLGGLCEQ
jgi:uncharacterized protein (DUF1697 family)